MSENKNRPQINYRVGAPSICENESTFVFNLPMLEY